MRVRTGAFAAAALLLALGAAQAVRDAASGMRSACRRGDLAWSGFSVGQRSVTAAATAWRLRPPLRLAVFLRDGLRLGIPGTYGEGDDPVVARWLAHGAGAR